MLATAQRFALETLDWLAGNPCFTLELRSALFFNCCSLDPSKKGADTGPTSSSSNHTTNRRLPPLPRNHVSGAGHSNGPKKANIPRLPVQSKRHQSRGYLSRWFSRNQNDLAMNPSRKHQGMVLSFSIATQKMPSHNSVWDPSLRTSNMLLPPSPTPPHTTHHTHPNLKGCVTKHTRQKTSEGTSAQLHPW